jgi:hypothetical protein
MLNLIMIPLTIVIMFLTSSVTIIKMLSRRSLKEEFERSFSVDSRRGRVRDWDS